MVALYKTQLGSGPTKVRSHWAGADALLATLEDSLTPADDFIAVAERLTKRRVRAFVSGIDTAEDVSAKLFYFDPEEEE
jgi:uncharacterized protein YbcI